MSNKSLFNKTLIKKEFKSLYPIALLNFVYLAIYFPFRFLQIIMEISSGGIQMYDFIRQFRYFPDGSFVIIEGIFMVVASVMMFSSEKGSKTIEVLATAPFSRKQIYINKVFAGLLMFILPSAIIYLSTYAIVASDPLISSVIFLSYTGEMFLLGLFVKMLVFAYFVMVSMLFGSTIATFICGSIFSTMPAALYALVMEFTNNSLYNFQGKEIFMKLSPSMHLVYLSEGMLSGSANKYVILIFAAIYFVAGYLLFDMYKMEKNGEFLTFKWTEVVFKVGFFICMVLLMGIIFGAMLYQVSSAEFINKLIGAVIGGILGYFIPKNLISSKREV